MCFLRYFLIFIFLLFPFGCQKNHFSHKHTKNHQYLRVSFGSDIRSLDPRVGVDFPSVFVTKMLFDGLMRIGLHGKVEPAIADSYEISEDHLTYIFHLRPAKWSNGDEITAYDFEYSWKQIIDPTSGFNLGVQNFYAIKNAREVVKGEKSIESVGIKALNEKTLRVQLTHPTPYFLEVTATSPFFPINPRVDRENPNWFNQNGCLFVCNGPFTLEYRKVEDEIVVKRNPNYWDSSSVHLPGIRIAIIQEPGTQLNLFEKNQLEWLGKPLSKIPLDAMDHLRKKNAIQFLPTLGLYWYFFNTESFPFHNKKMRKAFAYAINRQLIIDHVLKGEEKPALSVLPGKLATQKEGYFRDNDPEKAFALFNEALEELGITKDDLPEITINYNTAAVHMRTAEALQQQWNKIFGINIKIEQQEWKFHYEKLQKGNFQIGGMQWQSWLRDPLYIMQTFREKMDGVNMSRWSSPEFSELIDLAEREIDPIKRKNLFHQAEIILMDEMPVIPVYFGTIAYAKSQNLKDVYLSEVYEVDFRWASLEE